jgi:hypothetical protein
MRLASVAIPSFGYARKNVRDTAKIISRSLPENRICATKATEKKKARQNKGFICNVETSMLDTLEVMERMTAGTRLNWYPLALLNNEGYVGNG